MRARSWPIALSLLAGCNAITGASDLVIGDDQANVDGGTTSSGDASTDATVTPPKDATGSDVAIDAPGDAGADVKPDVLPRPDGGRFVFVSSFTMDGALSGPGGVASADQICTLLASNAKLGGSWMAWLSTANVNAIDRLGSAVGPWYLVNGTLAVSGPSQLTNNPITHPINLTETGTAPLGDNRVWTSTNSVGVYMGNGDCSGYTSNSVGLKANAGSSSATGAQWTATGAPSCDNLLHLYCFEL